LCQQYKDALGDKFSLITAFSREGPKKVYVQHRLQEQAKEVNDLLLQKAYFYVCGDAANMAREVNTVLAKIISEQRGIPESKAEDAVKSMRSANQYQVRRSLTSLPLSVLHFVIRFAEAASEYPLVNKF
jgi:NADPH-ferrihemoprotein reductase